MEELTVYISYSGKDKDLVKQFITILDQKRIPHRDSLSERIEGKISDFEEKIGAGKIVVIFFSNDYFKSPHCMNEYANIIKYLNKEKVIFRFKCGKVSFNSLANRLLKYWGGQKSLFENSDFGSLKEIEQRTLNNSAYIDKNTEYCVQKLNNFFSQEVYDKTISILADAVSNKYQQLLENSISVNCIKPIAQSQLALDHNGVFIKNATIDEYIAKLRDKEIPSVLIIGPSGIGKSKLIYESFGKLTDNLSIFYTIYKKDIEDPLSTEFKLLISKRKANDGIVIFDNCPLDFFRRLQDLRNKEQSNFKIIAANNDVLTEKTERQIEAETIMLSPNVLKVCIEDYIKNELKDSNIPDNQLRLIQQMSDGYPQIAVELVSKCLKKESIGWHTIEHIMPKLLNFNPQEDKDEIVIMQTFSLCMPFPYNGQSRDAFKYILNMEHITPLGSMDYIRRRSLAERLIRKYKSSYIDNRGEWLNVRPFPLSVWLTEQWFKNVCNSSEHFKELIDDIQSQDNNIQSVIIEGFCKHIKEMYGVQSAYDLVGDLTYMECSSPFFSADVMCTRFGSELLLAMSTINPPAVANCLYEIIDTQSIVWLKQSLTDDYRRSIVFALEKLCFAKESYHKAIMTMAKLAVAENDNIGNNATGLLKQLFHVRLAGTEVDLRARLETLKSFVKKGGEYERVTLSCLKSAFTMGGFTRTGNSERFGFENKIDYIPQSNEEIVNYWYTCRDILIDLLNNKSYLSDLTADIVVNYTLQWVRYGLGDILFPLLEKVASIKGNNWNEEYSELKWTLKRSKEDLSESISDNIAYWLTALKPKSFITDLKEAQQEIISKYQLPNEVRVKSAREIIEPLAQKFISERIYENQDELKTIITDNQYNDYWFADVVVAKMSHDNIECFFSMALDIILADDNITLNRFFINFCEASKEKVEFQVFLEKLYANGETIIYVNLLAQTEYQDFRNFNRLTKDISDEKLNKNALIDYVSAFHPKYDGDYEKIVILFNKIYPNDYKLLVDYIINNHFYADNFENTEYLNVISQALVKYNLGDETEHNIYEYVRLVIDILESTDNKEFAAEINKKMIDLYNSKMTHIGYEGIFNILLHKYLDTIWDYFSTKLISPDYSTFFYQVKDEIGSGTGFGRGALFQTDDDRIKQLCKDNPETAPSKIALMAPCFDFVPDNQKQEQFSEWFMWLLDNYGNQREVRSNLDCNLGSFAWTGNTIPYHQRNIKSFEKLYDHKFVEVREWARLCVKGEKERLQQEKRFDDYEKMSEI
ncbi:MAG: toll/interleukin-1 receptor domain-containing protein [Bacteroidales bacterium]|nr:toll/interleukin-1 receptor domain-containing protein [Bacteroidales bacterium]